MTNILNKWPQEKTNKWTSTTTTSMTFWTWTWHILMIQHAPVSIQLSPISFKFINMKKKHTHTHTPSIQNKILYIYDQIAVAISFYSNLRLQLVVFTWPCYWYTCHISHSSVSTSVISEPMNRSFDRCCFVIRFISMN